MRNAWLLLCLTFIFTTAGPNSGGTFATEAGGGDTDLTSPTNAGASDNSYAIVGLGPGNISYLLKATNFSFSLPASTVNGITVEWEQSATSATAIKDFQVSIIKGGTVGATNKANTNFWTLTDTYVSYGGAADLWGLSWSYTDVNASTFGAALACYYVPVSSGKIARIDHVRITVTYTETSTGRTHRVIGYGNGITRDEELN